MTNSSSYNTQIMAQRSKKYIWGEKNKGIFRTTKNVVVDCELSRDFHAFNED